MFMRGAQCVYAFLLKPAPFYKLFAGVGSTNQTATFLSFSSQTLVLSLLRLPLFRLSISHSSISGGNYPLCFLSFCKQSTVSPRSLISSGK